MRMRIMNSMDMYLALKDALGLPDHCVEVNIRLAVDEAVVVEAKYYAPEKALNPDTGLVDIFTRCYKLVEIDQQEYMASGLTPQQIITGFDNLIEHQR